MNKILKWLLPVLCTALIVFVAVGCVFGDDSEVLPGDSTDFYTTYTIQYSDDTGIKSIKVAPGALYSFTDLPSREGYRFTGLWSQKTGGTQYVDENGGSISPFTDKTNLVLYPQFEPLTYTFLLDFGEADPSGNTRTFTARYDEELPALATDLRVDHKDFVGWFTQPDCGGTQVADAYGLLPKYTKLTSSGYSLPENQEIELYAGFRWKTYTLTLYIDEPNGIYEEVQVEYGTPLSAVHTERRVGGKAVLSWSRTKGDTELKNVFTGKITEDMILFAAEYAPVIDFETRGGEALTSLIAKQGSRITLPVPKRECYQFIGWETVEGEEYTTSVMPSEGITLYARWQRVTISFSSNGGSRVDDITIRPGDELTLPTPTKSGYVFAGWYDEYRQLYTSTIMPEESIRLQAGWYVEKSNTVIYIPSNTDKLWADRWDIRVPQMNRETCFEVNINDLTGGKSTTVRVEFNIKIKSRENLTNRLYVDFYSKKQASSTYLLKKRDLGDYTTSYKQFAFTEEVTVSENFYIVFYCGQDKYTVASDCYCTVYYADTSAVLFS